LKINVGCKEVSYTFISLEKVYSNGGPRYESGAVDEEG